MFTCSCSLTILTLFSAAAASSSLFTTRGETTLVPKGASERTSDSEVSEDEDEV